VHATAVLLPFFYKTHPLSWTCSSHSSRDWTCTKYVSLSHFSLPFEHLFQITQRYIDLRGQCKYRLQTTFSRPPYCIYFLVEKIFMLRIITLRVIKSKPMSIVFWCIFYAHRLAFTANGSLIFLFGNMTVTRIEWMHCWQRHSSLRSSVVAVDILLTSCEFWPSTTFTLQWCDLWRVHVTSQM
jgi:hypothetical protein